MKKINDFLVKIFHIVKDWIAANGIEGTLGLLLGLLLWVTQFKVFAGFAFGVFFMKNLDLLKSWFSSKLK